MLSSRLIDAISRSRGYLWSRYQRSVDEQSRRNFDLYYNQILDELHEFWGARDTRHLHHPFLIHEFGNSAFVIRNGGEAVAYLFGFLSQTEPVGYVHAVAVRTSARRQRLAQELFGHFAEFARRHGCKHVKAITTPSNLESIAFHES